MATELKRPADLYAEDFHAWAEAQMEALRRGAGRLPAEIDAEHLIEELDMARRRDRAAASSQVMRAVEHLLKLEHSPSEAPRNTWLRTVRSARTALRRLLTPSLRRAVEADLAELYAVARENAAGALQDHDVFEAADALPERCPYTLDQITGDWLPCPAERSDRAAGRDSG
jgi:hypothetical protein